MHHAPAHAPPEVVSCRPLATDLKTPSRQLSMEGRLVTTEYGGAPIHAGSLFVGAVHAHFSQRLPEKRLEQASGGTPRTVPKIVPSGGLFPFGSRLGKKSQTSMNTGESKV
jgi:hypothetical protein